jgi:hypothetical protein
MRYLFNLNTWTFAFATIAQLALFLRWLYRRIRSDEQNRAFVRDMATNHLPHIYDLLVKLADKHGIAHHPPPSIRWVDFTKR